MNAFAVKTVGGRLLSISVSIPIEELERLKDAINVALSDCPNDLHALDTFQALKDTLDSVE